jgi:hypothetical protein
MMMFGRVFRVSGDEFGFVVVGRETHTCTDRETDARAHKHKHTRAQRQRDAS